MNPVACRSRPFRVVFVLMTLCTLAASPSVRRPLQPFGMNVRAPKFDSRDEHWLNTGGRRIEVGKGQVCVVEFWTYGCINCRRNLPSYARWQERFAKQKLTIIGVHTPETDAETKPENVREQVGKLGITYPVLLDPDRANWKRWKQWIWPAVYLVDKRGHVRFRWLGEIEAQDAGGEEKMARCIEQLLAEP